MKPDAAIEFLRSNDLGKLLGQHSGLFSVQLQPPGTTAPAGQGTNGAYGADLAAMAEAAKALAIRGRG
jgi:hypothetical protein